MPLSCSCDYDDYGDGPWIEWPNYYEILATNNSRTCISCGQRIAPGNLCAPFRRWRRPRTDIEERIHGEEVALATHFHCERCADLGFSLDELGFCFSPYEDMRDLVAEYAEMVKLEREERKHEREQNAGLT